MSCTYAKRRGVRTSHFELRTNFVLAFFCMCLRCGWVHRHLLCWGWVETSGCPTLWGCSMVCIGKNIANGSKDPQFLPVMCAMCARCAHTTPCKLFAKIITPPSCPSNAYVQATLGVGYIHFVDFGCAFFNSFYCVPCVLPDNWVLRSTEFIFCVKAALLAKRAFVAWFTSWF